MSHSVTLSILDRSDGTLREHRFLGGNQLAEELGMSLRPYLDTAHVAAGQRWYNPAPPEVLLAAFCDSVRYHGSPTAQYLRELVQRFPVSNYIWFVSDDF